MTWPIMRACRPRRSWPCSTGWSARCWGARTASPPALRCAPRWPSARLPPRHALDLLSAFRLDVTKHRYADWDDLMDYCAFSAMPVGRFVLDVHGEAALDLARLRCPLRGAAGDQPSAGLRRRIIATSIGSISLSMPLPPRARGPEALAAPRASRRAARLHPRSGRSARRCFWRRPRPSPLQIADRRLALEVSVIHRLAARLTAGLAQRDPLSERVHLSGLESAPLALLAMGQTLLSRLIHRPAVKPASGHRP